MSSEMIYHMCREEEWRAAEASGIYPGSPQDVADGFIHFSTGSQVIHIVFIDLAGQGALILLTVNSLALGDRLKWEPARGGQLFPHLYGKLTVSSVVRADPLPLHPDGVHKFSDLATGG